MKTKKRTKHKPTADIIELVVQQKKLFPFRRREFEKDSLVDKILVDIIDVTNELRILKKHTPEGIFSFSNLEVQKKYEKNNDRIFVLEEKLKYLTGLMVA